MSGTEAHIAALFQTSAAAHAAQAALIAAGIPASRIMVMDRGNPASAAHAPKSLWGALKARLLPDHHAHHYAEAICRGHPLLIVDVDAALHDAAIAALQAQTPLDVAEHAENWRDDGWSGEHSSQEAWREDQDDEGSAAGSEGMVGRSLLVGDYGAVGGARRDTRADTDIQRGILVRVYRIR
jgi:hypothetical protein